jgi:hypothetical protein
MKYKRLIGLLGLFPTAVCAQTGEWELPVLDFGPSFEDRTVAST